jgi:hypothetical protein
MEENQVTPRPEQPADDHLLENLAALTGLFNPERIWQEEQLLDDMAEKEAGSR